MSSMVKVPVRERPKTRQMIRGMVDNYFLGVPWEGIGQYGHVKGHKIFRSSSNSSLFNHYAGETHEGLVHAWNNGRPTYTTCNGLAGLMFNRLFASKKKGINGLDFKLQEQCMAVAPLAWLSQSENPDARPGYGDILSYKPPKLHAAICLGSEQANWQVIQSGQGSMRVGADIIAKGRDPYPINRVVGWINVAILWDYDEIAVEHQQMQKDWNESPWDAMIKWNRSRRN